MKNVVIFQDFIQQKTYGHEWKLDELFSYFRAQIDNSLRLGWKTSDIVVCTNLDFEYKDVTILRLEDICQYNKYFNKQYGIAEILRRELITEPFWFHDFDDWQLQKFEFPTFSGDIGFCKYIDDSQWNTGSIFVKPTSLDIWELIVEFMKLNENHPELLQLGDEDILNFMYAQYGEIQHRFNLLNNRYNLGCTQFEHRYQSCEFPIYVGAFKPNDLNSYNKFFNKNLIDNELQNIFKEHKLL
jgi:hypothetical protein